MPERRLLLFNLRMDLDDPVLGFAVRWVNALATQYDAVDVLTMQAGRYEVPANVRVFSVGRERGYSEARRLLLFYARLLDLLRRHRYSACFAHMMPLFAALGGPLLALRRVPLTLWYTHRQPGRVLALATRFSRHIVTAAPGSFPYATPKLRVIGHGIDTEFFAPAPAPATAARVVYVARLAPIKQQHLLLEAAAGLADAEIVLVGDVPPADGPAYRERLQAQIHAAKLSARVQMPGSLPPAAVRDQLHAAAVAVNLSPPGLFDKAALEALACGLPTLVASPDFAPLLSEDAPRLLLEWPVSAEALRAKIAALLALDPAERARIGAGLRARVSTAHSLPQLIARLVQVLQTAND